MCLIKRLVAHANLDPNLAFLLVKFDCIHQRMEHGLFEYLPVGKVLVRRSVILVFFDQVNDFVGNLLALDHRDKRLDCLFECSFDLISIKSRSQDNDVFSFMKRCLFIIERIENSRILPEHQISLALSFVLSSSFTVSACSVAFFFLNEVFELILDTR